MNFQFICLPLIILLSTPGSVLTLWCNCSRSRSVSPLGFDIIFSQLKTWKGGPVSPQTAGYGQAGGCASCTGVREWFTLEGTTGTHLFQPPAQAGSPRPLRIVSRWLLRSPGKEAPEPLCPSAQSPSQYRNSSSYRGRCSEKQSKVIPLHEFGGVHSSGDPDVQLSFGMHFSTYIYQ